MGFMMAVSACAGCGRIFGYNPDRVPSIRIEGVREPVCGDCVARANPIREANGLDPIAVHPEAYQAADDGWGEE